MTGNSKIALLVVDSDKGERMIVVHDDCAVVVRQHALAAQSRGAVVVDGKTVPITGGFVLVSWREPAVTWRFRCDPLKASKAKPKQQ